MIRPIDIRLNAAHPDLPLAEAVTYTGAPSTVLIRGVPGNCGRWAITAVFVAVTFPDGSTSTRTAVQSANGVWVATLPATATSGRTAHGLRILADGADENGEAVGGYVLGVADFAVASLGISPAPQPGETSWQMIYFDAVPGVLRKGDVTKVDGVLKLYNGTAWEAFAPSPSTSAPQMDGTAAPGTSASYARGDHVHPTDTSRVPTSRKVNGTALSSDVTLTGADIAVSGTDATKISAALAGKASTADATLTERGPNHDGFSAWECSLGAGYHVEWYNGGQDNSGWYVVEDETGFVETDPKGDANSTSLSWTAGVDAAINCSATRTALPGYQLGSQTDKPLASEAEAEELRTAVANKPIILDVAQHSRITVGGVQFQVVLYWNSTRDRFFMTAQRVGTWLTQSGEWQSSAEAYTHTWESGGVTYTATRAAGPLYTSVYINGVESPLDNIASRCAGKDVGDGTAYAFYDTLNAYFATYDRDGNDISDTYIKKPATFTTGNLAALDAQGNPTDAGIAKTSVATMPQTGLDNNLVKIGSAGGLEDAGWSAGDLARYSLVAKTISNGAVTLDDRAMNAVAVSSALASLTVNFPTATSGKVRDFAMRLNIAAGVTAPEIAWPQGVTCENADGEVPEIGADGAATILYFTETAAGVFLVKGEVVTAITQA